MQRLIFMLFRQCVFCTILVVLFKGLGQLGAPDLHKGVSDVLRVASFNVVGLEPFHVLALFLLVFVPKIRVVAVFGRLLRAAVLRALWGFESDVCHHLVFNN